MRLLYKPVGILVSVLGGMLATEGTRRLTGCWPGDDSGADLAEGDAERARGA